MRRRTLGREQERKLYAPILWVKAPDADYFKMSDFRDEVSERFPRIIWEVSDSGGNGYPVGMKILESEDAMTASPMFFDRKRLIYMGEEIRRATGASRVGYDMSMKPPSTIELF